MSNKLSLKDKLYVQFINEESPKHPNYEAETRADYYEQIAINYDLFASWLIKYFDTRPNDAKKMIAEIELLTKALKISCRHQLIVEALSLPECDEMIEQYDDSDDQELMDSYIERAKQSSEGEEG